MKPHRPESILEEWASVANAARRPDAAPRPIVQRSGLPLATLTGAVAIVVAIAIAGIVLGRPVRDEVAAISPSAIAPSAVASSPVTLPSASPSSSATAQATPPATPGPTAVPTPGPCDLAELAAVIIRWDGAAGHRIAEVNLANVGSRECIVDDLARPELLGGGAILIEGAAPSSTHPLLIAPGKQLQTLVDTANYCGNEPRPPVTVGFVLADGHRLVAQPVSPTDTTLPPCNGPTLPATIAMHPWSR